jgi:uncharacterized membrane protein YdbT with pleckstrin-like domain
MMRTSLKPGEKVQLVTKLHWYTSLFFPLLFAFLFLVAGIYLGSQLSYFYLVALGAVIYAVIKILQRQCNIWAVTNLRVIDENGLLTHYAIESPLDKINNVSYSQSLWGRLLGYGNVMIQTAAGHGITTYTGVANPQLLKDTITTMQEEYRKSFSVDEAKAIASRFSEQQNERPSLSNELEKIYELKQKGVLSEDEYNALKAKILNS